MTARNFTLNSENRGNVPSVPVFHGHVREWSELTSQMQNALEEAGLTDGRGNIIP